MDLTRVNEAFSVKANVLVPPFHRYYFNLNIDGWVVVPTSGGTEYVKIFEPNSKRSAWLHSITNLRYILLASFLDDFAPRVIDNFQIESIITDENRLALSLVFGSNIFENNNTSIEDSAKKASYISGEIFNGQYNNNPHYQPDINRIQFWYDTFNSNTGLAINLNFIMQSFVLFNKYFSNFSFYDPTDLLNGIVFLVSGLEGIFLKGQNDISDLLFKFRTIGSIYYDRYVEEEMLKRFGTSDKKFSIQNFREILRLLYKLRSSIAHGDYEVLYKPKTWKEMITRMNVHYDNKDPIDIILKHAAMALGIFEKHILSLVIGAEENLLKGPKIMDDVAYIYPKQKK